MSEGRYEMTRDNYEDLLYKEKEFYLSFDYESLNNQPDYDDDYFAAELLMKTEPDFFTKRPE